MKGLSVNAFWSIKPKLPFRFKAHFYTGIDKLNNILSIALTNITLPKMEGKASEGSMYLGNTIFTIPTWSIGSRKLEITFEETDNMIVTQFIDLVNSNSWGKEPYRITIAVEEFDDKMRYSKSTGYVCHLSSFTEPQFKRDGQAGQVTISATFIIDAIIDEWDESKVIAGNTKTNNNSQYNQNAIFEDHHDTSKIDFGGIPEHLKPGASGEPGTITDGSALGGKHKANTMDSNGYKGVDKNALNQPQAYNVHNARPNPDKVKENMKKLGMKDKDIKDELYAVNHDNNINEAQMKNLSVLTDHLVNSKSELNNKGINISFNSWTRGVHETSDNAATHGMGAKVDITFTRNDGSKITYNNATAEELNTIQETLNKNGLYMQFEGDINSKNVNETGWGDVVLNEFVNNQGEIKVDKSVNSNKDWGEFMKFKTNSKPNK